MRYGSKARSSASSSGPDLRDGEHAAGRCRIVDLERDRPRGQRGLVRLIAGTEIGQAHVLRLDRGLAPDLQLEARGRIRAEARRARQVRPRSRTVAGLARFEKRHPAQRRAGRVEEGPAVGHAPLAHALEPVDVVERLERLRAVVADGADLGRDAEVDRDEVVHRRLVLVATLRAAEAAQDGAQAGKALDRAGAPRADQEPVHLEQADRGWRGGRGRSPRPRQGPARSRT